MDNPLTFSPQLGPQLFLMIQYGLSEKIVPFSVTIILWDTKHKCNEINVGEESDKEKQMNKQMINKRMKI